MRNKDKKTENTTIYIHLDSRRPDSIIVGNLPHGIDIEIYDHDIHDDDKNLVDMGEGVKAQYYHFSAS